MTKIRSLVILRRGPIVLGKENYYSNRLLGGIKTSQKSHIKAIPDRISWLLMHFEFPFKIHLRELYTYYYSNQYGVLPYWITIHTLALKVFGNLFDMVDVIAEPFI